MSIDVLPEEVASATQEVLSAGEERFEKWRKTIGLFLGPALLVLLILFPIEGLKPEAQRLAAVMSFVLVWWVCEPIPIPMTALLGPALCVVLGVADAKKLLAGFGDPIVFVFVGSFILAQAMMVHGLDRRVALTILGTRWVGNSTRRLIFAFGLVAAFLSMWLSNTATTAMLLPVALGILRELGDLEERRTGRLVDIRRMNLSTGLMLMTAYAASVGGIGTPIGTPPNLIGIGMINTMAGKQISFVGWMTFALPLLTAMYLMLFVLILWLHPPEIRRMEGLSDYLVERRRALGPWSRGQINTLIAFGTAVLLWTAPAFLAMADGPEAKAVKAYNQLMPEGVAALLAAGLLFVLPLNWGERRFTLTWEEASRIDWGTVFLFGSGIVIGSLAFSTGLAEAFGRTVVWVTGLSGAAGITLVAAFLGIIVSEATSNTASASMVIPVAIAVARQAGVDPVGPAMAACLGSSYGFMLPVSTAPNAMVYGTGMVPITRMVRAGLLFDAVGLLIIWGGLYLMGY